MPEMTISHLIDRAEAVLQPRLVGGRWFGDVAAAVETVSGQVHVGICVDTGATGFCAERAACVAMLTAGESRVRKIVAVWRDSGPQADPRLQVLAPCGTCRQFLLDIDPLNGETLVVLNSTDTKTLAELLPLHPWSAQPARAHEHREL